MNKPRQITDFPEPVPYPAGRVFHVYPHGFEGEKQEPSFEGLLCAYNFSCSGTDWSTTGRPRVRPGDTILVHGGLYQYNRYEYTTSDRNRLMPLAGTYFLTADGTADRPIAIKAAGDGEVIFDGVGNYTLFNVEAADYNYFEGITFRNTEIAILAGTQFITGSKGLTVKIPGLKTSVPGYSPISAAPAISISRTTGSTVAIILSG